MNSQIMLVDDSDARKDPSSTILYVTPDNMKNATISLGLSGTKPVYVIESNRAVTRTSLRYAHDTTPFAVLERRQMLSDKLALHGAEPIKVNKWFNYSGMFDVLCVFSFYSPRGRLPLIGALITSPVTLEIQGSQYIWKSSIMDELSLYSAHAPNVPIAWYQCSQKRIIDGRLAITAAYLVLQPDAVPIQDMVVLSFILLEHRSRMNRKAENIGIARNVNIGMDTLS